MKSITCRIIGAVALLFATSIHTFAIENLQLFLQCSNVVLYWPSTNDETYIVQYRPTLDPGDTWQTLTSSLPADVGTNLTYFVHSNVVQNPNCGGGGSYAMMSPGGGMGAMSSMTVAVSQPSGPMVMSASGAGAAVPLAIFPPGFDFSGSLIIDPTSGESISGVGYQIQWPSPKNAQLGGMQPMSGGIGGFDDPTPQDAEPTSPPDMGFYRVVRTGVHLFGLTNGTVLSGQVSLPIEFANLDTNKSLSEIYFFSATGDPAPVGITFPSFASPPAYNVNGVWDTTQATNGIYTLQIGATLDDGTEYLDQPITVSVDNPIWFPDSWNVGGQAVYVGAQTVYTNGTWHLDLYDDQDAYLGYLDGPIDANGYCAYPGITGPGFSLDNTDGYGNQNPSTYYTLVITANASSENGPTQNFYTPSSTVTNKVFIEPPWNGNTLGVVAYMQVFNENSLSALLVREMLQLVYAAEEPFHHSTLGTEQTPYQIYSQDEWAIVTNNLAATSCRDFFYFGHGNGNALGPNSSQSLNVSTINTLLANNTVNPLLATNRHPYRFVFLDGCLTADGNWPQAFGIPKVEGMTANDFIYKRSIRPRAFMGWSKSKFIDFLNGNAFNTSHADYIAAFWNTWAARNSQGGPLHNITDAKNAAADAGWPYSGGMKLYGAKDLVIDY